MSDVSEANSQRQRWAIIIALAVTYFVAGKLGLRLAFNHPSATAVWPPTGIALAACLVFGRWVWPGIFAGALIVNLTTAGSLLTGLGIATGNTLEAWVGAYLLERHGAGRRSLERAGGLFRFVLLAALFATTISASLGVATLLLSGAAAWDGAETIWLTWWLGDAGGALIVAPVLLLWSVAWDRRVNSRQALEAAALMVATVLVSELAFGLLPVPGSGAYSLDFLCTPLFIWAAFRFGQRLSAVVVAIVYAVAVYGTLNGLGPFARESLNASLLLLQAFACVASVTTLTLAALVAERRRVEERLRQLAVSDSLTGLGNYRHLIETIEKEIERSKRTERPFALLFLDLDRLKDINDRYGHLVGSRALWRVAEVLRKTSRAIDTAARYGGDEFALLLPESDAAAAEQVAERLKVLLQEDAEEPKVTVSTGIAVYPRDGEGAAPLLSAADNAQYAEKKRSSGEKASRA